MVFTAFTLLQIPLLGREFQWYQLTQLLFVFLFGFFVDFSRFLLGDFAIPTYFGRQLMLWAGILCIASGVTLYLRAKLIDLSPEGLVSAIMRNIPNSTFHRVKIGMDSTLVALAVLLSLLLLGNVYGVREGTLLSAVFIGKFIPYTTRAFSPLLEKLGF